MAGTTTDGIPYPQVGDNLTPLATWFANLAAGAQTAITSVRDEVGKSVANVAALPGTGNYNGRTRYVEDVAAFAVFQNGWRILTRGETTAWTPVGATTANQARYRKQDNIVQMTGIQNKGSGFGTGITLPAGFRPQAEIRFADAQNPTQQIVIGTSGVITYTNSNPSTINFGSVNFPAFQ